MANSNITKKAIHSAFMELLNEKQLSKITVKDVSDRCGINRNTFYYHYQDILELLEEICSEEADRIIINYPALNSFEDCLDAAMDFALKNKRAILHIFQSEGKDTYIASLWRICENVITTYANTVFPDIAISDYDRMLFIRYHKCALFGMLVDWITTGMKADSVEGLKRISELRKGSVELIIRNALESPNTPDDQL